MTAKLGIGVFGGFWVFEFFGGRPEFGIIRKIDIGVEFRTVEFWGGFEEFGILKICVGFELGFVENCPVCKLCALEICPSGCLGLGEEKKLPIEKPACDENSEKAVNWFFE